MSKTKTYMQERGHWTKQTMEGAEEKVPKTPKNNKVKNSQTKIYTLSDESGETGKIQEGVNLGDVTHM